MSDIEDRLRQLGDRVGSSIGSTTPPRSIRSHARFRRVVSAFGALAILGVAGLGGYFGVRELRGPSYTLAQSNVLSLAAAATEQQGTARVRLAMEMHVEGEGMNFDTEMTSEGEIDFRNGRGHMVADVSGIPMGGSESMEMIFLDGVQYTRSSSSSESKWVKSELPASASGFMMVPGSEQGDPTQLLDSLRAVSGEIQDLGEESIDGIAVTHYRATLDPDRFLDAMGQEAGPDVQEQLDAVEMDPMDVWIDEDQLLRQTTFGFGMRGNERWPGSFEMDMTMTISDYGIPVEVTAPAPSEIADDPSSAFGDDSEGFTMETGGFTMETESESTQYTPVEGPKLSAQAFLMVEDHVRGGQAEVCIAEVPKWSNDAEVIHEASGEVAMWFTPRILGNERSDDGTRFGCLRVPATTARSIKETPDAYTLYLRGGDRVVGIELQKR